MTKSATLILVTGATGAQGGATARELLAHGYRVRTMTRNPDSPAAQALIKAGAEVVRADMGDAVSVDKELIFTGDRITPQQAVEFGLANRVVAADQLMAEARRLADKLMAQPREALRETKKLMNLYLHQSAATILDAQLGRQLAATLSTEHQTIAKAFIEKQKRNQEQGK